MKPEIKPKLRGLDRKLLLGLNETGKTNWSVHFLEDKKYVVWDPNIDSPFKHNRSQLKIIWRPDNEFDPDELMDFFIWIRKTKALHGKGLWIVFDDFTNVVSRHKTLSDDIKMMINRGRHAPWYFNFMFIVHKYSSLHPDMRDLMLSGSVFRIDGELSIKALNEKRKGMGDAAAELDNYEFLTFEAGLKGFKVNKPVPKVTP